MSGIVGIFGHPEAANLVYLGLYALQHRGQMGAGIVASDGQQMTWHRGLGLVSDVFDREIIQQLKGPSAIGHNRNSSLGPTQALAQNTQPLVFEMGKDGLAIAHSGNLINADELRAQYDKRGAIFQSHLDTEIVAHLMASHSGDITDRVSHALSIIRGAYSLLFLNRTSMIAARDPHGFRPLVLGRIREATIVASETCALDLIGAEYVRELEPGEVLVMSPEGTRSFSLVSSAHTRCIFEYVYFARPDSIVYGRNVYRVRKEFGRQLAREHPVDADIVVPVPDSGVPAALGYAEESGLPFELGLIRNHYVGRTLIEPQGAIRDFGVKVKLNAQRQVLEGKRVVVVDDSIVRGTTSRKIVAMLHAAGARTVHVRISSPPTKCGCHYGNTPDSAELIALNQSVGAIRDFIAADSLAYLSEGGLYAALGADKRSGFCSTCFAQK